MTNFEKIKNMGVEEMAIQIERFSNYVCVGYDICRDCPFNLMVDGNCSKKRLILWLESEVKNNE